MQSSFLLLPEFWSPPDHIPCSPSSSCSWSCLQEPDRDATGHFHLWALSRDSQEIRGRHWLQTKPRTEQLVRGQGGLRSEALPKEIIAQCHGKRQHPDHIAQAGPPFLAVLLPGSPNPLPWSPYQAEAPGIERKDPPFTHTSRVSFEGRL